MIISKYVSSTRDGLQIIELFLSFESHTNLFCYFNDCKTQNKTRKELKFKTQLF